MKNLRLSLLLAVLAVAAGVGACSDNSPTKADPAGPLWDCGGGYLGGGGGRRDSSGVCIQSPPVPADSI